MKIKYLFATAFVVMYLVTFASIARADSFTTNTTANDGLIGTLDLRGPITLTQVVDNEVPIITRDHVMILGSSQLSTSWYGSNAYHKGPGVNGTVPEPASILLLGIGLMGIASKMRSRRREK